MIQALLSLLLGIVLIPAVTACLDSDALGGISSQ